jgi:hypothetical protein
MSDHEPGKPFPLSPNRPNRHSQPHSKVCEVHNIGVNWPHHLFVNHDFKVVGAKWLPSQLCNAHFAGICAAQWAA